ncbi:MAG: HipA domain-containing protein [Veillonella sp.]
MVKFPDPNRSPKKTALSYMNNHYSEYLGCHIFQMLGIPVQHTFLGRGTPPNSKREKVVVACEVFCQDEPGRLIEFSKFLLHETDSEKRKKTTIEDVMRVIDEDVMIKNKTQLKEFFWDMFVVDAFIGNGDRHLDNWGLIEKTNAPLSPAPVYDCGSYGILRIIVLRCLWTNVRLLGNPQKIPTNALHRHRIHRVLYRCIRFP